MVHPYMFPEDIVSDDAKPDVVKDDVKLDQVKDDVKPFFVEIDVGQYFRNETLFITREHMLEWVRMEAKQLEFGVVFRRSDNGLNRRQAFITMRYERSSTYTPPIWKLKYDDTRSRKCECPFKLRRYYKVNNT